MATSIVRPIFCLITLQNPAEFIINKKRIIFSINIYICIKKERETHVTVLFFFALGNPVCPEDAASKVDSDFHAS